jgi:hypothetical protein
MDKVVVHAFFICFWGALTAGYLRGHSCGDRHGVCPRAEATPFGRAARDGARDCWTFSFLMFVVVQLRYFFGGAGTGRRDERAHVRELRA